MTDSNGQKGGLHIIHTTIPAEPGKNTWSQIILCRHLIHRTKDILFLAIVMHTFFFKKKHAALDAKFGMHTF